MVWDSEKNSPNSPAMLKKKWIDFSIRIIAQARAFRQSKVLILSYSIAKKGERNAKYLMIVCITCKTSGEKNKLTYRVWEFTAMIKYMIEKG